MTSSDPVAAPATRVSRGRPGRQGAIARGAAAIVVVAVVGALAALGALGAAGRPPKAAGPASAPRAVPTPGGVMMPFEGRDHVVPGSVITYKHYPPTSGTHYYVWAPLGVYPAPAYPHPLPVGYWVHNLEHGAIVVLYHCPRACPTLAKQLGALVSTFPLDKHGQVKMIVTPYDHMQHRIAIVAWRWIDQMDAFDRTRLLGFYRKHVGQGPEDIGPDQYIDR